MAKRAQIDASVDNNLLHEATKTVKATKGSKKTGAGISNAAVEEQAQLTQASWKQSKRLQDGEADISPANLNGDVQPVANSAKKPRKGMQALANAEPKTTSKPTQQSSCVQTKQPVAPTCTKKRHTKEDITADKAKAEAKIKEDEELARERHRAMKQMDIDEDADRAKAAAKMVRKLEDLEGDSESGEEFVVYDDMSGSDGSDTSSSEGSEQNAQPKPAKLPVKAKTSRTASSKEKQDGGKKSGAGGKKKQVTFASGLCQDWQSTTKQASKRSCVQISSGSLEDSDAEDSNPYSPSNDPEPHTELTEATDAKRNLLHRNEMVEIVTSDSEEYEPRFTQKPKKTKAQAVRVKSEPRNESSIPPKGSKAITTIPKPKSRRRLNGNNVRVADLPDFAQGKWRTKFLPTLYDKFFSSEKPFDTFIASSNDFVAFIQSVVDDVYPDVDYTVTSSDSIHFLAYNRINEKRSNIGSNALEVIEGHLKKLKDHEHKEWLCWALRKDGPLFFKTPSPMDSPTDQNDPNYQFPGGRLLSPFIIDLVTPLLKLSIGSVSRREYPKGLIALILAGLERAVRYNLKPSAQVPEFSKDRCAANVQTYYDSFQGVQDGHWKELLAIGGLSEETSEETLEADLSILDHGRPFMFNFSSPVKGHK